MNPAPHIDLDKAIRDFKAYCEHNGDFDELDLKEVIDAYVTARVIKELERIEAVTPFVGAVNRNTYLRNRINELKQKQGSNDGR